MSTTIGSRRMEPPVGFWLKNGALTGALAGAVAANFFILLVVISLILSDGYRFYNQLGSLFQVVVVYFLYGQFFGTLPSVLLGLVSGMIIGYCFCYLQRVDRLKSGKVEGFKISLVLMAILLGVYVWIGREWNEWFYNQVRQLNSYVLLPLGTTLLLYLIAGAWGGDRLFRQWQKEWGD